MGLDEIDLPSPNWTLCPRRRHFIAKTGILLRGECLKLPMLVLPQRQCLTAGARIGGEGGGVMMGRTLDHECYAQQLKEFTDTVFSTDTDSWESIPLTSSMLRKVTATDEVNSDNMRAWRYPAKLLDPECSRGLSLYRVEWEWTNVKSADDALYEVRRSYFDPTYVDDESDYFLVEKMAPFKNTGLKNPLVFRALWRPHPFFTTRDWLEYVFVDEKTKTVISRSCKHPHHAEYGMYSTWVHMALFKVIPTIGIYRAGAYYSIRFAPPAPGRTGCTVQLSFWYSMQGAPDALARLGVSRIETEYLTSVARQFDGMTTRYTEQQKTKKAGGSDNIVVPFDLLH